MNLDVERENLDVLSDQRHNSGRLSLGALFECYRYSIAL